MNLKITLVFFFILGIIACSKKTDKPYNSKLSIRDEIKTITNITIDTTQFSVLVDSIHNTEEAIDDDYTWFVTIQFDKDYFKQVKKNILSSNHYNAVTHENDPNWSSINTTTTKGVWYSETKFFKYVQKPKESNFQPVYISVDTLTKKLELLLIQL
jgi:hypothetical protein